MTSLDHFIRELRHYPGSETVANPYVNRALAENLRVYLTEMLARGGERVLLVGEAPGYRGCKLTGIPFTSGTVFARSEHPFIRKIGPRIHLATVESENTATIVWDYLFGRETVPLFWNSFPFHPHPAGNGLGNRAPTAQEMREGLRFLARLGEMYRPGRIGGIGGKGTLAARRAFPDREVARIRHPSHGGKRDFIAGMDILLTGLG